jgi:hypothetical protein
MNSDLTLLLFRIPASPAVGSGMLIVLVAGSAGEIRKKDVHGYWCLASRDNGG